MPIEDPFKRSVAAKALLNFKVCRKCGARNPVSATKCRKCKNTNLRPKKSKLVRK